MKQMVLGKDVASEQRPVGELTSHFVRDSGGRVFFYEVVKQDRFAYPVLEDGSVSRKGSLVDAERAKELVEVVKAQDIGLTEIVWTDDYPEQGPRAPETHADVLFMVNTTALIAQNG